MSELRDGAVLIDTQYTPRDIQTEIHIASAKHRFMVLNLHRRIGKCIAVDTPILTVNRGWISFGEVVVGDTVYAPNGTRTEVIGAYDAYTDKECYEIVFNDGTKIIADKDHYWYTETKYDRAHHTSIRGVRYHTPKEGCKKTTLEIKNTLTFCGEANHAIPVCEPLVGEHKELLIDPYLLGSWLCDGTSRSGGFTSMDDPVVSRFRDKGYVVNVKKCQHAGLATEYHICGLVTQLKIFNLLQNKHIPTVYLQASYKQRKELLQGLMDGDGSSTGRACEITQKSRRLIEDIRELLLSFGIRANIRNKVVNGDMYYRISFTPMFNPFWLERKAVKYYTNKGKSLRYRYIKEVNKVDSVPVRCITVAHSSHCFLIGRELIITSNTVLAINDLLDHLLFLEYRQPQGVYVAPTYGQAKRVAWDYFKLFTRMIPGVEYKEGELLVIIPRPHRNDVVKIWLLGAENPDSIRGMYIDYGVLDEFASMTPIIWSQVIRPALSDRKGKATFIGTPQGENHFYDIYLAAEEMGSEGGWYARTVTVEDSKIIDEAELESARKTMTADEYAQEYMCSFTAAMVGAYYSKYLEAAMEEGRITDVPHNPNMPVSTFWDLGVSDAMAIWFIQQQGQMYNVIDYMEFVGKGMDFYIQECYKRPYTYAKHYVPHDAKKRELISGTEVISSMENLGLRPLFRVPKANFKKDIINATRMVLPMCRFDRMKCGEGLRALKNYQAEWDAKLKKFKDTPRHDWACHGCFVGETEVKLIDRVSRIDEVVVGDKVSLGKHVGEVKYVYYSGEQEVIKIHFSNGKSLECTKGHKIFTKNGLIYADALSYGDEVLTEEDIPCQIKLSVRVDLSINARSFEEKNTTREKKETTIRKSIPEQSTYIEKYGYFIKEKFLKDIIYIIRTVIRKIIILITSNVCLIHSTQNYTEKLISGLGQKGIRNKLSEQEKKQNCGMPQRKDLDGTQFTVKKRGRIEKSIVKCAKSAVKNIGRTIRIDQNSAEKNAVVVVAIEREGKVKKTYDLTVSLHHAYLANGILVSNSDAFGTFARGRDESSFIPSHVINNKLPVQALTEYNEFDY